jgi:hypothetical protein
MSAGNWFHLLPSIDAFPSPFDPSASLSAEQAEQLQAIRRTADCHSRTLGFGIAAIGNLLANAAQEGDGITADTAIHLGWLLHSIGELSAKLADVGECAQNKLTAFKREG